MVAEDDLIQEQQLLPSFACNHDTTGWYDTQFPHVSIETCQMHAKCAEALFSSEQHTVAMQSEFLLVRELLWYLTILLVVMYVIGFFLSESNT